MKDHSKRQSDTQVRCLRARLENTSRFACKDSGCRMRDTRYGILVSGYWFLDTGFWMPVSGCWFLDAQDDPPSHIQYPASCIEHPASDINHRLSVIGQFREVIFRCALSTASQEILGKALVSLTPSPLRGTPPIQGESFLGRTEKAPPLATHRGRFFAPMRQYDISSLKRLCNVW